MEVGTLSTILITLITVLGGNAAWKYYEKRLTFKLEQKRIDNKEDAMHVNDLRSRIEKLEKLLEEAKEEKDELREEIVKLTAETAAMKTELEYLAKENELLRQLIGAPKSKPKKSSAKKKN